MIVLINIHMQSHAFFLIH